MTTAGPTRKPPPDWDQRYAGAGPGGLYGDRPNEYLRMISARSDFRPASALMLADGDGRNGTWLARQGVAVTAVDLSEVATERALARDAAAGVSVERFAADLADWTPQAGREWDAVMLFYMHGPPEVRDRALARAAAALAPDGWVVVEAFAKAQATRPEMGPDTVANLFSIAELEALFAGFTVVEAFTGRTLLGEGSAHRGEAEVVRFAARKPVA